MLDYPGPDADSIRGQWEALERMKKSGLVRDLAVSNFSTAQLDIVLGTGGSPVAVNQLPFSLANRLTGVVRANAERGVLVQSWSPLSRYCKRCQPPSFPFLKRGFFAMDIRLTKPELKLCGEVGERHGKTAHQVALRWIVQKGAGFAVQSKSRAHFQEDLDVFTWGLTDDEMAYLDKYA